MVLAISVVAINFSDLASNVYFDVSFVVVQNIAALRYNDENVPIREIEAVEIVALTCGWVKKSALYPFRIDQQTALPSLIGQHVLLRLCVSRKSK